MTGFPNRSPRDPPARVPRNARRAAIPRITPDEAIGLSAADVRNGRFTGRSCLRLGQGGLLVAPPGFRGGDALELGLADPEPDAGIQSQFADCRSVHVQPGARPDATKPRGAVRGDLGASMIPADGVVVGEHDGVERRAADRQSVDEAELIDAAISVSDSQEEAGGMAAAS